MTKIKRAAIAGRVSTTEQAVEGYSIDAQLEKTRKYAELSDWEVVGEYRDAGVPGSLALGERPEGARLIRDAKLGKFEVVIFTRIDRFARSVRKALDDFEQLQEFGVEVVFVEEKIDTSTPQGRLFRTLLAAFAEFEREQIRDRNMAGRYAKAASGAGWATGPTPFGYAVGESGQLEVVEEEAAAIRLAFKLRARGLSLRQIAKRLGEAGHRPRQRRSKDGNPIPHEFGSSAISMHLTNTAFLGEPIVRSLAPSDGAPAEEFEFPAPAIVSRELWDAAQKASARKRLTLPPASKARRYALAGRIWHRHGDESESTMFGQARKDATPEGETRWYRCTVSRHNTKRNLPPSCDGFGEWSGNVATAVQADFVEGYALRWLLDHLADPARLETLIQEADHDLLGDLTGEDPGDIRVRIAQIKRTMNRWLEQYAEDLIDRDERDERIAGLTVDLEAAERELVRAEAASALAGGGLVLDINELFATVVVEAGGEDWAKGEIAAGSSEWWHWLGTAAVASTTGVDDANRYEKLPPSVLAELEALAGRLDLHVIVEKSAHPKRPSVRVSFDPAAMMTGEGTRYLTKGNNSSHHRDGHGPSSILGRVEDWAYRPDDAQDE